ncbi:hypothetical protein [Paludibaculum fermentans]|uniref:Uncharacterized protein n=1 Tax=Paludibaculum fermentans TaxID=1473598 RepID=A0A7S7NVV0_PALFE|nr:hypothetical protein [Paludibaculum fermentans]QOY90753.1 hypothetical protein IRI77_12645 [Paludibaculum fermentans]
MNPEDGNQAGGTPIDQETGEPIQALRDQEMETSPAFTAKVRRSIHRRTTAAQVAGYSWHLPKVTLLEMARLLGYVVKTAGKDKE